MYSNNLSLNGNGIYMIEPEQIQRVQVNYMKRLPRCPLPLLLPYCLLLPTMYHGLIKLYYMISYQRRRMPGPGLWVIL